jgi:hypothetical protein
MREAEPGTEEAEDDVSPEELGPLIAGVYRHDPTAGVDLLFAAGRRMHAKRAPHPAGMTPTPVPLHRVQPQPTGAEPARKDETCAPESNPSKQEAAGASPVEPDSDPYEEAGAARARRRLSQLSPDK